MLIKDLGKIGIVSDLDPTQLPANAFSDGENVRFTPRGVERAFGFGSTLSPGPITPTWLKVFPPIETPLWVYGNGTRMFALDGVLHQEITRESGNYSGGDFDRWQSTMLSGIPVFNLSTDIPQMWPFMALGSKLEDLSNWPTNWRCGFIKSFKNLLIAGNMIQGGFDYPYRINWSHPAAPGTVPTDWDPSNPATDTGERDLGETTDIIIDGLDLGDLFIVYREESTYAMQYIGAPLFFSSWRLLFDGEGILWKDCVAKFPGGHLVLTRSDVIVHTGQQGSSTSVLDQRRKKWLFKRLSGANYKNSFVMVNQPETEIWICVPEDEAQYATRAVIWNWTSGGLGDMVLPGVPFITPGIRTSTDGGEAWG
jgi:hypothetical protein